MPLSEVIYFCTSAVAIGLIVIGLFFLFVAAVGVLRLPDVFTRSHAVSLTDSLGALFLLSGLAVYQGISTNLIKILIVLVLLYLLNPVIAHATVRSAHRSGLKPWSREDA
jgi:multicomponent Na+:H+ antiporter subunit G